MNLRKDHYRDETERTPREESAGGGGVGDRRGSPLPRPARENASTNGSGSPDGSSARRRTPGPVAPHAVALALFGLRGLRTRALRDGPPPTSSSPRTPPPGGGSRTPSDGGEPPGGGVWGGPAPGARSGPPGRLRGADRGAAGRKNGSPVCRGESEGAARETGRRRETSPRAGAPVGGGRRDLDS